MDKRYVSTESSFLSIFFHALNHASSSLKDAKREDLVTLAFHAWVFVMMVLTVSHCRQRARRMSIQYNIYSQVVNESIPHLYVLLFDHYR